MILSEGKALTAKDIQADFPIDAHSPGQAGQSEETLVRDAILRSNGNISAAAKALGVSRPTLYAKMKKYGL